MNDIQALCKRVYVIHNGASLFDGEFDDLVKEQLKDENAEFLPEDDLKKLRNKMEQEYQDAWVTIFSKHVGAYDQTLLTLDNTDAGSDSLDLKILG